MLWLYIDSCYGYIEIYAMVIYRFMLWLYRDVEITIKDLFVTTSF